MAAQGAPRVPSAAGSGRGHRPLRCPPARCRCRVGLIAPAFLRELFRNRSPGTSWTKGLCEARAGEGRLGDGNVEIPGGGARTRFWPAARGSPKSWGLHSAPGWGGRLEEGREGRRPERKGGRPWVHRAGWRPPRCPCMSLELRRSPGPAGAGGGGSSRGSGSPGPQGPCSVSE